MVTMSLLVLHSNVNRFGAVTFVSKEGNEFTGKDMKMRKVVVHDEDETSMWVISNGLPDGRVVKANVVPFPEMLMRYVAWGIAPRHVRRMSGPNVELTSVAI
jgi:hypothetical protein